jgi:hypothetical protein
MRTALALFFLLAASGTAAQPPVYHLLWFDTEDYIEPTADDAALRLAEALTSRGVRGTFKIVGEKARVMEARGRLDVLRALARHEIGYHAENHSIPPAPAVYLQNMGLLDGAAEFERREGPGFRDLVRIFGVTPSCHGQPGNSWAPQANLALRKWGIHVYMDDGRQVGLAEQPFWFGGILYVFNLGPNTIRADINDPSKLADTLRKYDETAAALRSRGGGVMQTYYHPTEFVTTEFWDGVNFRYGANPERGGWQKPRLRTKESSEQAYRLFLEFVAHAKVTPGVRLVTANELRQLMEEPVRSVPPALGKRLAEGIDTYEGYSAADLLISLLGMAPQYADGPSRRGATSVATAQIARAPFERAKKDAADFIRVAGRLPEVVWVGSERLSLPDFAATLAGDEGGSMVAVRKARLDLEQHIGKDAGRNYDWVIHPKGFAPEELLEMARLQAWTLKPARLR